MDKCERCNEKSNHVHNFTFKVEEYISYNCCCMQCANEIDYECICQTPQMLIMIETKSNKLIRNGDA